tara:strand:- start:275 stop:475 length:201 start_codon:yes stop_codon:yes gene_type:complete
MFINLSTIDYPMEFLIESFIGIILFFIIRAMIKILNQSLGKKPYNDKSMEANLKKIAQKATQNYDR